MKGKIENTIPQRQYENIKVTYYFENEEEKEDAMQASIQDCILYAHVVSKTIEEYKNYDPKLPEIEKVRNGVKYKRIGGQWHKLDEESGNYRTLKPGEVLPE